MEVRTELDLLRQQLQEAQETLRAIRDGEVDAFVMQSRGVYRVESLASSDTPYRVLVESVRGGALTVSSSGEVLFGNRGFAEKIGVPAAELINTPVSQWLSVEPSLERLFEEARRGEAHAEGVLRTQTGFVPVSATACALPNELSAPVYCLVLTDLSDRVAAERLRAEQALLERQRSELDAICRQLPFGVVLAEGPDLYRYLNPAADALLRVHAELRAHTNLATTRALSNAPTDAVEIRTAGEATFLLRVSPVVMPGMKPRALVVIQDVSAQRQAQRAKEREEQLREMFVGILGHDLRAPLMAITTAADVLEHYVSGERVEQGLGRIRSAVSRMKRLIDDMLDLTQSRIGGGIPLSPTAVDLRNVLRTALDDVQATSEMRVDVDARGDTSGNWDEARLGQVITNLCMNAIQHGARATPVQIRVDGTDPDDVTLSVRNDGPPIAPELVSTIFDPFRRGPTRSGRGGGVGLGLYIAERIVGAHGGTIEVLSGEGIGTTFTVVLPRTGPRGDEA